MTNNNVLSFRVSSSSSSLALMQSQSLDGVMDLQHCCSAHRLCCLKRVQEKWKDDLRAFFFPLKLWHYSTVLSRSCESYPTGKDNAGKRQRNTNPETEEDINLLMLIYLAVAPALVSVTAVSCSVVLFCDGEKCKQTSGIYCFRRKAIQGWCKGLWLSWNGNGQRWLKPDGQRCDLNLRDP